MSWLSQYLHHSSPTPPATPAPTPSAGITEADAIVRALHQGVEEALDAALIAYLGPVGTALTPAAHAALALLEDRLHALVATLFDQVRTQGPTVGVSP